MSDVQDPIDFIYEQAKELKKRLEQQSGWISFMRDAGQDTTQLTIDYNNNKAKFAKWESALKAKGKIL